MRALILKNFTFPESNFEEHFNASRNVDPPFVRYLGKIVDLQNKINDEIDRLVDLKEQQRNAINLVPDRNEQLVLKERYINGKTWEQISVCLNADRSTVIRWHGKALKNFKIPENPIVI